MTFYALKHGNISQVNRVFEWFISFVTCVAFATFESAEVDRMLEGASLHIPLRRRRRVVNHGVADAAIVGDDFAAVTDMLTIVTTEAAREI